MADYKIIPFNSTEDDRDKLRYIIETWKKSSMSPGTVNNTSTIRALIDSEYNRLKFKEKH